MLFTNRFFASLACSAMAFAVTGCDDDGSGGVDGCVLVGEPITLLEGDMDERSLDVAVDGEGRYVVGLEPQRSIGEADGPRMIFNIGRDGALGTFSMVYEYGEPNPVALSSGDRVAGMSFEYNTDRGLDEVTVRTWSDEAWGAPTVAIERGDSGLYQKSEASARLLTDAQGVRALGWIMSGWAGGDERARVSVRGPDGEMTAPEMVFERAVDGFDGKHLSLAQGTDGRVHALGVQRTDQDETGLLYRIYDGRWSSLEMFGSVSAATLGTSERLVDVAVTGSGVVMVGEVDHYDEERVVIWRVEDDGAIVTELSRIPIPGDVGTDTLVMVPFGHDEVLIGTTALMQATGQDWPAWQPSVDLLHCDVDGCDPALTITSVPDVSYTQVELATWGTEGLVVWTQQNDGDVVGNYERSTFAQRFTCSP